MRIASNQGAQALPDSQRTSNPAVAKAGAPALSGVSSPVGGDQAQLSGIHVQIQALVVQVSQLPEATQEKVNALRQAIISGTYRRSPAQVAEALFSNLVVKLAA